MKTVKSTLGVAASALTIALTTAAPALAEPAAPTKAQCIDAFAKGQDLRRDGHLADAQEQLRLCASTACPAVVRDDCTQRLDEAVRAQPTLAFEVKDASGADVSDVTLTVDGKPFADTLHGRPLPVDPGRHTFELRVTGYAPIVRTLVVTEGAKGRLERVDLPAVASAQTAPSANRPTDSSATTPPLATTSATPAPPGFGTRRFVGVVVGGAGGVAVVVASVLGLMAIGHKNDQNSECPTSVACTTTGRAQAQSSHDAAVTDGTVSTVGFIVGGALLATGAALVLVGGHGAEAQGGVGVRVAPSVGANGAGVLLSARF
jgi:hypothetical protein